VATSGDYALVIDDGAHQQLTANVTLTGDAIVVDAFIQPPSDAA